MTEAAKTAALDAIYEEAEKLMKMNLDQNARKSVDLILALARYQHDVRGTHEKKGGTSN